MTTKTEIALWRLGAYLTIAMLAVFVASVSHAQAVPGKADLSWQPVVTGCTIGVTPCDNVPISDTSAITGYEIHASTSPIPDDSTAAPVGTVTGSTVTFAYTTTVTNGQTLFFRVKAVNAFSKSPFSNEASKVIVVPVAPGVPTSVTITLTIG